jgi:hypothetical protein
MRTYTRHPTDSSLVIGSNGHVYAATRLPENGTWNIREAWEILDTFQPGVIPEWARLLLSGLIAATLDRVEKEARLDERLAMSRETRQ